MINLDSWQGWCIGPTFSQHPGAHHLLKENMLSIMSMYTTSIKYFMDLTGEYVPEGVELALMDSPFNTRGGMNRPYSTHDFLTKEDMEWVVDVIGVAFSTDGHAVVLLSSIQFQDWYDSFEILLMKHTRISPARCRS